jgi:hypothetical protein
MILLSLTIILVLFCTEEDSSVALDREGEEGKTAESQNSQMGLSGTHRWNPVESEMASDSVRWMLEALWNLIGGLLASAIRRTVHSVVGD